MTILGAQLEENDVHFTLVTRPMLSHKQWCVVRLDMSIQTIQYNTVRGRLCFPVRLILKVRRYLEMSSNDQHCPAMTAMSSNAQQ